MTESTFLLPGETGYHHTDGDLLKHPELCLRQNRRRAFETLFNTLFKTPQKASQNNTHYTVVLSQFRVWTYIYIVVLLLYVIAPFDIVYCLPSLATFGQK